MADIKISNLHKEFGVGDDKVVALENVNLEISGHVFVSIVGPSGCGKSTLLNILSGIETPTSGSLTITQAGAQAAPGYVFQAARLLPWRTVMDNLLFVQADKSSETRARCQKYLDMVQLGDMINIIRTSCQVVCSSASDWRARWRPMLIFMDEPFSHLDAITARSLRRELHSMWAATKKTIVFVTHDVGEAVELSNRILVFAQGGILKDDINVELDFPRDPSDEAVAVAKANVLKKFEELDLLAT